MKLGPDLRTSLNGKKQRSTNSEMYEFNVDINQSFLSLIELHGRNLDLITDKPKYDCDCGVAGAGSCELSDSDLWIILSCY